MNTTLRARVPGSKVTVRRLFDCGSAVTSNSAGSTSTRVKSWQLVVSDEHDPVMRYSSSSPGWMTLFDAVFTTDSSPSAAIEMPPAAGGVVVSGVAAGVVVAGVVDVGSVVLKGVDDSLLSAAGLVVGAGSAGADEVSGAAGGSTGGTTGSSANATTGTAATNVAAATTSARSMRVGEWRRPVAILCRPSCILLARRAVTDRWNDCPAVDPAGKREFGTEPNWLGNTASLGKLRHHRSSNPQSARVTRIMDASSAATRSALSE